MASLGKNIARLNRARRQMESYSRAAGRFQAARDKAGQSGGIMTHTARFGANPGALKMFSYAPADLPAGAPLVVVLHGCTQTAEAHAAAAGWLALADRHRFAVLAPEQTTANNSNRCFSWFEPADAARGKGEAASIRAMVARALRDQGGDPARVFVTGLSAGGAMTSVMLAAYPDVFAGGAVVAGLPFGVADNLSQALGAMFSDRGHTAADLGRSVSAAAPAGSPVPRVTIWHGDADAMVQPHNAVHIARQWAEVHGLAADPDEIETLPGRTRALWRSGGGEVVLESNLIQGFGHGTPLATGGADGVGAVAPYMLEAGVSAPLEIARFWGLAPQGARPAAAPVQPIAANDAGPAAAAPAAAGQVAYGDWAAPSMGGVQEIIEQALRSAGLMK